MNKGEALISIALLRDLVHLEPETGKLYWKPRPLNLFKAGKYQARTWEWWNTWYAGEEAFATMSGNGYLHGALFDQKMTAHRVVYALANGSWPEETIDHVNGTRTDNRPSNLRDVAHLENMRNQPRSRASTTGVTGVHFDATRGKYEAYITVYGKVEHLGRFACITSAAAARKAADEKYGFHSNHGRSTYANS